MAEERIKLLSITELSLELQNEGLSASAADTYEGKPYKCAVVCGAPRFV